MTGKRRSNCRHDGNRRMLAVEALEPRHLLSTGLPTAGVLSTDPKDPSIARIGVDLAALWDQYQAGLAQGAQPAAMSALASAGVASQMPLVGNSVVIDAVASGSAATLASDLTRLGAVVTGVAGQMVSALLPVSEIYAANALTSLAFATPAESGGGIGAVTSQGDQAMGSDVARSTLGYDGAGVTVGVLSDSYDNLGGAAKDVSTGDLPGVGNPDGFTTPVNVIEDEPILSLNGNGSDEGRAMLQIVHDVAPGANLAFATAAEGQASYADNIEALQAAGCKVIVDDYYYDEEPFFQNGPIAQAVEKVAAAGVDYFAAAQNDAGNSYQAAFNPGATYPADYFTAGSYYGLPQVFFGGVAQNFATSGPESDFQSITIQNQATVKICLQWDSPYRSLDPTGTPNDLDLYLIDPVTNSVVVSAADDVLGQDPIQYFKYTNTTGSAQTLDLMIVKYGGGPNPGTIKYISRGNPYADVTVNDFNTQSSTVMGHANLPPTVETTVGAADYADTPAFGVSPPVPEFFSSLGGTPIFFDQSGNRLASPLILQQPNIVGPDDVSTTFFDTPNGTSFLFRGTSAAAPHVAAVAALMLEADPSLTQAEIQSAMDSTATSFGTAAPNYLTGYGLINAQAALNSLHVAVRPSGDLAVNLSVSPLTVFPGATLTYTVTVTNNGPGDAQTVTLTDPLPANTGFVSASAVAGWTSVNPLPGSPGTVSYAVAALAPGASGSFTIRVQVNGNAPAGPISDTATVSGSPPDLNLANNSKTALATLVLSGAALFPDPVNPALTDLVVSGTAASDSILFVPGVGGTVSAYLNGVLLGNFAPTGRIVAYGQAGNDFICVSPLITLPAFLYGGPGNNILVAGGGNSVLVGGTGNDTLRSGRGRNILIGGAGSNSLNGIFGDNIEIGGYTDYDNNDIALANLLAEWSRQDLPAATSYSTRLAHLRGAIAGGLNGPYFLNAVPTALSAAATVHGNAAVDFLYGGMGTNWYFAHTSGAAPLDHVFFRKPAEVIDAIP